MYVFKVLSYKFEFYTIYFLCEKFMVKINPDDKVFNNKKKPQCFYLFYLNR